MRSSPVPVILAAAVTLVACGGGDNPPTKPDIVVVISPSFPHVQVGQTRQFTATVTGTANQAVTWAVMGGAGRGTIDSTGLYTAPQTVPEPPSVAIRAVSLADTSKDATVYAVITPPAVTVTVAPAVAAVQLGETQQFTATVSGATNTTVIWSVDGGASNGTIDNSGLYSAPIAVPDPATVTVRATSIADTVRAGTAQVTVVDPVPAGFVVVPSGTFTFGDGDPSTPCGNSVYTVTLTRDFFLGQTEVTNDEYLQMLQWAYDRGVVATTDTSVVDAVGPNQELYNLDGTGAEIGFDGGAFFLRDAGHGINPTHPVVQVTWKGAAAYCDWLNLKENLPTSYDHFSWLCNGGNPYGAVGYRLPTDAEWEYAARFPDGRIYSWGNEAPDCWRANWWGQDGGCAGWTVPVGSTEAEKMIGGRDIFDMTGNVWEWCNDWHRCAAAPTPIDPVGPLTEVSHVLRGGSWQSSNAAYLRCSTRYYTSVGLPTYELPVYGLRVARTRPLDQHFQSAKM